MSRRSNSRDPDIGSDSFLDIIANIVGILIILIVVAGLKVSRQPIERFNDEPAPVVVELVEVAESSRDDSIEELPAAEPTRPSGVLPESEPEKPSIADDPWDTDYVPWVAVDESPGPDLQGGSLNPVVVMHASPELLERRDELTRSVSKVSLRLANARREELSLEGQVTLRSEQITTAANLVSETTDELKRTEQAAEAARRRLEINRLQLATLTKQLKTAQQPQTKIETIRHRLNPVSQEVSDKEVHFRLSRARLSIVPIAELLSETMRQIRRRSDSLMRFNRHTGRVGPIDGYAMNYAVERQSLSVLEKLRSGEGYVRIEVTEATLEATDLLREMTVDEALRPGSEFSSQLHQVGPDTSLTFWVYPDSFEAFRTIQSVMHDLGFAVAARPIPEGTPIGVSPRGSRSNAQ
jgi:hypothetical protein